MFKFLKRSEPETATKAATAPSPPYVDAQALLARISWSSVKRLDGVLQGDYRTLFRGSGLMLADLREYTPQDDVRHIDWNVTARMQRPFVRQYEQDRELAAWFLVDLSASIDFGSSQRTKRLLASEAVATLGQLIMQHGNRVGTIIDSSSGRLDVLPARASRQHLLHILRRTLSTPIAASPGMTSLNRMLTQAARLIRQRSTIFILSDFYSEPGWEKGLMLLAQRHDVIAIRLIDPMERALPNLGMLTMRDPETGEQLFLDTSDAHFRQRFAQQSLKHEENLMSCLSKAGVDCLELETSAPVHESLIRFVRQRQQLLRQPISGVHHAPGI